ncbi:NAD-dependent protein deacetylase [Frankia sp. CNm7]|uniref:protein acetyllysine N-acetyltransferase n=2 Tax=Frankia nepalensis TaxID=1836974 RepID=A0A937UTQ8_9ACTN|nr:NAD-dependent protein deacetylase [Frankia nepalensis]MBL7510556.1 NAD-dependent protein deacetylase [Frankia nepalensis]MBL7518282.1 NAD-dependent protein deacetylase [Frankia nepalensis]MBL7633343.1 NAD-dependent protein deacetylase [Frankia nepalensis]
MGVDSGLPDFRGNAGFWRAYPPYARLGMSFVDLADPEHFAADPELAWGFYGHRLGLYRRTVPHAGFEILRRWGANLPGGARVFTSNVDGQFQRAGFGGVAEVHGSIHHLQCVRPCSDDVWPADGVEIELDEATMRATGPFPTCGRCGALARPNILMFGDGGWVPGPSETALGELSAWLRDVLERQAATGAGRLVVVELGAGGAIPTVRLHAERAAAASDAVAGLNTSGVGAGSLIRINPTEPAVRPGAGISLPTGALAALTALDTRCAEFPTLRRAVGDEWPNFDREDTRRF